jgi:hypothetical protein|eukprot:g735.t1
MSQFAFAFAPINQQENVSSPRKRTANMANLVQDENERRGSPWRPQQVRIQPPRAAKTPLIEKSIALRHQQQQKIRKPIAVPFNLSSEGTAILPQSKPVVPEGVASKEDVVTVLPSTDIKPSTNPVEETSSALAEMTIGTVWAKQFYAVESIRRLAIHHPKHLVHHLPSIGRAVANSCMNLRSAVAKNAVLALGDLVSSMKEKMLSEIGNIVFTLLDRATCDKKFLRDAANNTLEKIIKVLACESILLALLKCAHHKSHGLRGRVAVFVDYCLKQMGTSGVSKICNLRTVVGEAALLFSGRSQDARKGGKAALMKLYLAIGQKKFEAELKSTSIHDVEAKKILSEVRPKARNSWVRTGLSLKDKIRLRREAHKQAESVAQARGGNRGGLMML